MRRWKAISEIGKGPAPAVPDISCVQTGLHHQLEKGKVPATLWAEQTGRIRLFMERDTIHETWRKPPEFAQQLSVMKPNSSSCLQTADRCAEWVIKYAPPLENCGGLLLAPTKAQQIDPQASSCFIAR
jgi:hypothetical protein